MKPKVNLSKPVKKVHFAEDSFEDAEQDTFLFRRKIFLIYLCTSMLMAFTAAAVSLVLDLTIIPFRQLLRGQIESAFIVMFSYSLFILIITLAGFYCYARRGFKTLITYAIFSTTLFMLMLMCIVYSMAMRHEFKVHLKPTMLKGLKNYGEIKGADINRHWDNLQKKFSCCGIYAAEDWYQNDYVHKALPDSCCKQFAKGCGVKLHKQHSSNGAFHGQGCHHVFNEWLGLYTYGLIGFEIILGLWQLIGVFLSWNLARVAKHIPKELRLQNVKESINDTIKKKMEIFTV